MKDKEEVLAIIKKVGVGLRDTNYPMLWFEVSFLGGESLICISWSEAADIIISNDISDTQNLKGASCVLSIKNNTVRFVKLFKP